MSFLLCFIFVVFAGCVCFFVGVSASDSTSSFLSLSLGFYFLVFLSCFFFLLFLRSMFFLPVVCLILFLFFSFSYVSFCDSPLFCFYVSFCPLFSFCILFDFCLLCVFSPCSSSFSSSVFSSHQAPRVRLKRNTNEKNNYLILFAFRGSLRKCTLRKVIVYLFFWWMSYCSQNMYLLDIVGICSEGVRDSLLLLICCYIVVLVFGEEPSFLSNLSLVPAFLGFVLFCVRVFFFFFWVLLLLPSFVEVYFLVFLIFLILGCCYFAAVWSWWFFNFISWLLVCASRFRCCHFVLNLVGGLVGRANREGSIYFLPFFIITVFGRKHVFPSGKRVFWHGFGFDIGHGRVQKTIAFSLLSHETL